MVFAIYCLESLLLGMYNKIVKNIFVLQSINHDGAEPSRGEFFKLTHTKSGGTLAVDQGSAEAFVSVAMTVICSICYCCTL